jgi:broad specificity phosphatase PhoE
MTASIISYGLKLPVRISPDLNERDFGSLSGLSWSEIERDLGVDLKSADKALTYDYRGFGGEDIEQVKERISRFLETMRCEEKGNDVLCVTHDGIIKLFYESLPHEHRTPIENGTVHLFRASI